jgi:NTP pyrophosphatase (non-canonical NTP hydrolase)
MGLSDVQKTVESWISRFEEGYFPPLAMLARLTEETGELARAVSHRFGGKRPKSGEGNEEIGEELADVLFVLVCFANSLGIDLDSAFAAVMAKYRERDAGRWTEKKE